MNQLQYAEGKDRGGEMCQMKSKLCLEGERNKEER